MRWDIFCHVVDNYGDAGVCLRLARKLVHSSTDTVFLWVDKPDVINALVGNQHNFAAIDNDVSLQVPAPGTLTLRHWQRGAAQNGLFPSQIEITGAPQAVIATFGCELDASTLAAMAAAKVAPVWINLEYLSAERYIERSHGLPSPQPGGLTQWYFYPGFTARSGGLLLEPPLQGGSKSAHMNAKPTVFLFSYESAAIVGLAAACGTLGWQLALAAGRSQDYACSTIDSDIMNAVAHKHLFMSQQKFDQKLYGNVLNIVRGEDSFVQAQGTGCPLVWHSYPQVDGAHWPKLEAFFALYSEGCDAAASAALWAVWRLFNQLGEDLARHTVPPATELWLELAAHLPLLQAHAQLWAQKLHKQPDLSAQLRRFVHGKLYPA